MCCANSVSQACPHQWFDGDYTTDSYDTTNHATTHCTPCPDGWTSHFTGGSGSTGLTDTAATVCLQCAEGLYDDDDDPSNLCLNCPDGYTTQNDANQLVAIAATKCTFRSS